MKESIEELIKSLAEECSEEGKSLILMVMENDPEDDKKAGTQGAIRGTQNDVANCLSTMMLESSDFREIVFAVVQEFDKILVKKGENNE